ncbi:MAG TPA: sulfite exporter TauE/SafE family protein [Burkholderiaceae bacterium]|nr:sulfite exporter TauE/SafE family protein [Burkholderiaceae bacterium]
MSAGAFVGAQLATVLGQPPTPWLLAAVAVAFLLGGVVKGLLGVGLPLVAMPLLALLIPSPKAIALMALPILLSNVWQAADGGHARAALRRFAWLLVPMMVATLVAVRLTLTMPEPTLRATVAAALLVAVALMAWNPRLDIDARGERRWGVAVGLASGLMGGASSLMGPLLIAYLTALRLDRETFVGSISVIYLAGAVPLFGAMALAGVLSLPEVVLSALGLAPMALGMTIGRAARRHVSEAKFRRLLLAFLVTVAISLVVR